MKERREFLKLVGLFLVDASCNSEKLFGPQCGTLTQPIDNLDRRDVLISNGDLDSQLATLPKNEAIALHLEGSFETQGVYRWGQYATRNLGKNWTVQGNAEISLVPTVRDNQPLYLLAGPASRVSGITVRGNHSQLASSWSGSLRTGGVLIEGDGLIRGVTLRDFGATGSIGYETFVAEMEGSGEISNCTFADFSPEHSDTQVSVYRITGPLAVMRGNRTYASGINWVQAHCIYKAVHGVVRDNESHGARFGYYGDYFATRGVEISGNRFLGCEHGIQLRLAPTPTELAGSFSHQGYTIGWNEIQSSGTQVSLIADAPLSETRFIRDIAVHPGLSLENFGAENVTRGLRCVA